jgi:tripartite-type tricarboxylate transporter receptor subunit TctC
MEDLMRTRHRLIPVVLGVVLAAGGAHAQQKYPVRPIRLIVPYAPGGGTDIVARVIAQKLTEAFGASVVVDNRPGASGSIGIETGVRANADGYTAIIVSASYATNAVLSKLPYDAVNDVAPIALISETGFLVALHPSVPVKSIPDLIAYNKANPGKLNYGTSGAGGINHLATELFTQMTATKMTHLPYKGTSLAMNELLGGHIQITFGAIALMLPQVKANRLRGIAVTTAKRTRAAPDIPTVGETVTGYEAAQWFAVLGPKALPKDIVARWNTEIDRIVQLPDVKERMAGEGLEPVGGSAERFQAVLKRDVAKWQKVVKSGNIKAEI